MLPGASVSQWLKHTIFAQRVVGSNPRKSQWWWQEEHLTLIRSLKVSMLIKEYKRKQR